MSSSVDEFLIYLLCLLKHAVAIFAIVNGGQIDGTVQGVAIEVRPSDRTLVHKGRTQMRNSYIAGGAVLLALVAATFASAQTTTVSGKVTASQIASTGTVGIWEKKLNCHGEADCARALVRAGGKYVLVTNKGTYGLTDQAKAAEFA